MFVLLVVMGTTVTVRQYTGSVISCDGFKKFGSTFAEVLKFKLFMFRSNVMISCIQFGAWPWWSMCLLWDVTDQDVSDIGDLDAITVLNYSEKIHSVTITIFITIEPHPNYSLFTVYRTSDHETMKHMEE